MTQSEVSIKYLIAEIVLILHSNAFSIVYFRYTLNTVFKVFCNVAEWYLTR